MIQGASRNAAAAAGTELNRVLEASSADADAMAGELFAVARLLDRELTLRRMLADPSRTPDSRAQLAEGLLASQVSTSTRQVVAAAVRQRWSRPSHLADVLEDLAVRAVITSAERAGQLDNLEDELFRFARIVVGEPALRSAMADQRVDAARKAELLESLVGGRVSAQTRALLDQAVRGHGGRTFEHALEHYSGIAAARRERLVAHVRAVIELDNEQRARLRAALARIYGREVALNVEVDESVLGGLSVRIGDEIVDATVASRLDEARRRLTG